MVKKCAKEFYPLHKNIHNDVKVLSNACDRLFDKFMKILIVNKN